MMCGYNQGIRNCRNRKASDRQAITLYHKNNISTGDQKTIIDILNWCLITSLIRIAACAVALAG
ncbi:hypothetical protein ACQP6C_07115 [Snodgrassella alvi]|uniref:hypothetical protein n=1 Tax=Snodgrassella alvi TaxID=1196083 RepID=UPI003CFF8A06